MSRPVFPTNADPRVVTVWSDVACPTAALALHVLHRRARARRVPFLIDHRAVPSELVDGSPIAKDAVDGEIAAITADHPELDWRPWPGPDATYPITSLLALEAVQVAKSASCGGLHGSAQLDAALRHAFLAEGRCISMYPVVVDVVRSCALVHAEPMLEALVAGTGRTKVLSQWAVAARAGITAPHLSTAGGFAGPGSDTPAGGLPSSWADRLLDTL